ncbi:MAG: hypothetical protein ACKKL6_01325 [Candidatus Komeilibacteria bacterium]
MFRRLLDIIQRKKVLRLKKRYLILLTAIIIILILLIIIYSLSFNPGNIEYGMTFSHKYAKELGINYQDAFVNLADDLGIKKFRMMAYWDSIEMDKGVYDFTELDWLIRRADYSGAEVILVVGRRQPRWPECHQPEWVEDLTRSEQMQEELAMIKEVVNHFRKYDNIIAWQVENEPFLSVFGECPETTDEFYIEKLNLVKSLDSRPTIITDSGELSTWKKSAKLNPILGSSIYRYVWNPLYGDFIYPLPPAYYNFKAKALYKTTQLREVFISELQLEPWTSKAIIDVSLEDQFKSMNINRFNDSIRYAKRIGFDNIYLWGGEWWYWLKTTQGDDSFWRAAKELINK